MTLGNYGPGPVSTRHSNRKETPPDPTNTQEKKLSGGGDCYTRRPPPGKVMDYTRRPPPGRFKKWEPQDDISSSDGSSTGAKRGGMAKLYPNLEKMLNDSNGDLLVPMKESSMDRSNRSGSTCSETQMFSDSLTSFQVTLLDGSGASTKGSTPIGNTNSRFADMDQSRSSRTSRHHQQHSSTKKTSRFLSDASVTSMQSDARSRDRPPKPSLREATPPRSTRHLRDQSPPPRLLDMSGRDRSPPRRARDMSPPRNSQRESSRRDLYHRRDSSPGRGPRGDHQQRSSRRGFDDRDRSVSHYEGRNHHRGYEDPSWRGYEEPLEERGRGYYYTGEYEHDRYYPEEDDERSRRFYHTHTRGGGPTGHQDCYRDEYGYDVREREGRRDLRDYYERSGSYRRGGEVYDRRGYEPRYYDNERGYRQDEGRHQDTRYDARYGREDPSYDSRYSGRDTPLYANDRYDPRSVSDHGYRHPRRERRHNDRRLERSGREEMPRHNRYDERSLQSRREDCDRFEQEEEAEASYAPQRRLDEDYDLDPRAEPHHRDSRSRHRPGDDRCQEKQQQRLHEEHHTRPGAFCEKGSGKGKLKDDSLYADSSSSRPGAFHEKRKGQLKDDKASSHTAGNDDPIYIEVFPRVTERLRRTKETKDAIAKDFYAPATCFACNMDIFCIADVKYYICPDCKCVNPLTDDGKCGNPPRTDVGIAFGYETLYKMQAELVHARGDILCESPRGS